MKNYHGVEFDSSSDEEVPLEQGRADSPSARNTSGPMAHLESVSRMMMNQQNSFGSSMFTIDPNAFSNFHIESPAYLKEPSARKSPERPPTRSPRKDAVSSLLIEPGNVFMASDESGGDSSLGFSPRKDEFTIPVDLPMMAPEIAVETTIIQEPKFVFDTMDVPMPGSTSRHHAAFSTHRTLTAVIEEDENEVAAQVDMGGSNNLRKKCKINEIHVKELLGRLGDVSKTAPDGVSMFIDRDGFKECIESLYELNRVIPPQEEGVLDALFDSLNHSVNKDRIPTTDVISGLVLSAGGSRDEKMAAIFCLVDSQDEGSLNIQELVTFFTLIFQNVFNKQILGAMRFNGVNASDPDSLAVRTASECMDMCDLNEKGRITYDELLNWIEKPKHSPVIGPSYRRR